MKRAYVNYKKNLKNILEYALNCRLYNKTYNYITKYMCAISFFLMSNILCSLLQFELSY